MLETEDLRLDRARMTDWEAMYRNVWSQPSCNRYMFWQLTGSEEETRARMERTMAFQEAHPTCFTVFHKASGEAIGYAGIGEVSPGVWEETGICLGPDYVGRGYGRQVLRALLGLARDLGAREFLYSTRPENQPSRALARSFGFIFTGTEERTDPENGASYALEKYRLVFDKKMQF